MSDYYTLLTNAGLAYETACKAAGKPIKLSKISVGDGNGAVYNPDATATALRREVWRGDLNALFQDPNNSSWLMAEATIPNDVGGWYVREAGIWTDTGILYAVIKYAESFKPVLATSGQGKEFYLRAIFQTSNAASVTLLIDDSVVKATRAWVTSYVADELAKRDSKQSVRAATTGPIVASGAQLVDTVAVVAGDRVLRKDEVDKSANGIFVVANGPWVRASDADSSVEVTPGLHVPVEEGAKNGDTVWMLVTDGPITLGVTALSFECLAGRSGVSIGTYFGVTVDKYGRVIAGLNPSTLAGYGITDTYTKAEVDAIVLRSSALPVGAMVAFPRGTVPAGFLELDGSVQSIAAYPDLAAYLGTAFNTGGEGAGNFRLPESRGEFLRGWDHGRGVDVGRAVGSYQLDAFQGHFHDITGSPAGGDAAAGSAQNTLQGTDGAAMPGEKVIGPKTDGVNGIPRTASETRPRNLAVMWCLKAWAAPINQGSIDVAALVSELDALKAAVPVGSIVPFPKAAVPPGYLELDGSAQIITAYPALAAYLGTTYNNGTEPAGYFRLPDARGEFLRGWDHGRGADAGRTIGSGQKGTFHNIGGGPSPDAVTDYSVSTGSLSYQDLGLDDCSLADYPNARYGYASTPGAVGVPVRAEQNYGVMRPRNLAVMWCIKAWNAPVNQGSIDVAALAASIANLPLLGFGQTCQNVTASRVSGTVYTNTTGRPIFVSVSITTGGISATCGGVTVTTSAYHAAFIVPAGTTYSVTLVNPVNAVWSEMRA